MAHKKAGGSSKNGRDSNPQYRGVKAYGGQLVKAGSIIIRQCGTSYRAGPFVGCGRDNTLYARVAGYVVFSVGGPQNKRFVSIDPIAKEEVATEISIAS